MMMLMALFLFLHALSADNPYKYSASVPETVEAVAGSCVLIPCIFKISKSETGEELKTDGRVAASWLENVSKGNALGKMVYNSSTNTTKGFTRIQIYGNLKFKNCTTVFYNVKEHHAKPYHFRAEISDFKATFLDRPFKLSVIDSPGPPRVSELSDVSEGTSVNLTCTAAAPCPSQPPNITWSLPTGNTHTLIQDEKHGNRSLISILTFTATRSHHGKEIFCKASYLREDQSIVEANSSILLLNVKFSPAVVVASVSLPGPVAEGSSVTLTCNSSEANPPVQTYTWFKRGQNSAIGSGQTLTFNLSSSDEGPYYCRAEHPQGTKESAAVELMTIKEQDKSDMHSFPLKLVLGGCLGGLLLFVLIGFALRMKKSNSPHQDQPPHKDSGTCVSDVCKDESVHTSSPKASEDLEEQIHYGEIDFSKRPFRSSRKMTGQEQNSEYAEIHLSGKDAQATYQKAPATEELYAQVKLN